MYDKFQKKLIGFCILVITTILAVMTFIELKSIYEKQRLSDFSDFQCKMDNIYQSLSEQSILSLTWLGDVSVTNNLEIKVIDKQPLVYNKMETQLSGAFEQAKDRAQMDFALLDSSVSNSIYLKHVEFQMKDRAGVEYLASVAYIPKKYGTICVISLYNIFRNSIIKEVFLPVILTALGAIIILSILSCLAIKVMFKPIIQNHEAQIKFFAAASHELRSPLAVIISALSAMKYAPPKKSLEFFKIIENESFRMQRLINDIFTLSTLDNGMIAIHKELVSLTNILIEVYSKFISLAAMKEIDIKFVFPDILAPLISCDPERISQVLSIILDNAISYTPCGGMILITQLYRDNDIIVSIEDSGPGIADKDKNHIFKRFYRCDNSRTDKSHFGLGLSIAKEVIDLHNWEISVKDSSKGGASFIICIPIDEDF